MFKFLADITKLTEKNMSLSSLRRLRIFVFLSMPLFPLQALISLELLPNFIPGWIVGLLIIASIVGLMFMACSRLVNRFWVRDKYLDEWELRIKHRSMAFGFQVITWVVALFIILSIGFDETFETFFSEISVKGLFYGLGGVFLLGAYSQLLAQLAMIQPMEEDEFNSADVSRRSLNKPAIASVFVLVLFFLPIFAMGFIAGWNDAHTVALLADEAKSVCEARGSSVHWVSNKDEKDGNAGFACFDENRAAPEHSKVSEPSP